MKKLLLLLLLIPSLSWGALVADVAVLPNATVEVGEEVYLSATGTTYDDANLLLKARYEWDFGDGYYFRFDPTYTTVTRSGIAVTHYFMSTGEKTVTLSAKIFAGTNTAGNPEAFTEGRYGTMLGMGSTKTNIANAQFKYTINGTVYTLAANAVGTASGDDVVPKDKAGAVALDVGTDGEVHLIEAPDNATGYASADLARAGLPAVAADHVRIGTVAVFGTRKAFTFGTTNFDDVDISVYWKASAAQTVGTSIFTFFVGETLYTIPTYAIGYPVGDDVIPATKYGAIALDAGTDLVVDTIEATDNATGYATAALARAGLPAVAENHVRMGTVTMRKSDGAFTCGLTPLTASATTTTSFTPVESTPIATDTDTVVMTVTGTNPLAGFEIQHANFNNRTKQYLYVQIPEAAYTANATQLKMSLIDTTAEPDTTTVLETRAISSSSEEIFLLDHTGLTAAHDYVLQAQLLDASDDQITGGIWRDKFTTPATTPNVMINENNSFLVGGELFFPISTFMTDESKITSTIDQGGINSLSTEGHYSTHTSTTYGNYLDYAATKSLLVSGPGRGDYTIGVSPNRWQFNHDPDTMTAYVSANKANDAIFGWVWQDEPNMGGRPQQTYMPVIAAWAYVTKQEDPLRIVFNNMYGLDWSKLYGTAPIIYDYLGDDGLFGGKKWAQDVLAFDHYPIKYRLHPTLNFSTMGPYAAYFDLLDRAVTNNKNLIPLTPALNPGADDGYLTGITHSADQVYCEAWLNIIHGAKGIGWFQYFNTATIRWTSMKKVADQLNAGTIKLKDIVLLATSSKTVTDDSNVALNRVDQIARDHATGLWIFAARVTEPAPITGSLYTGIEPTTITTTFTVEDLLATDTVTVYDENRTITHGAGTFTDTFDENEVHIYKITTDVPEADTTDPIVTAFAIPETLEDLEVPITTFQCSDGVGVTGYLVNEVVSEPSGSDAGWASTAQTAYTFADRGAKTLYAWCKDAAGNISTSKSDTITLTTPNYDVTLSNTNCNVYPTEVQSTPSGETVSYTVAPMTGYEITSVSGCGGEYSASPYETAAITAPCTVTTVCSPVVGPVTVTKTVGTGCYVIPSDTQTITDGRIITLSVGALGGYDLLSATGCGGSISGGLYTTDYITEPCTIDVTCGGHLATLGSGGTITVGSGGSGGDPSCNSAIDEVGTSDTSGSAPSLSKDSAWCVLHTPSCYGPLNKAYVAHVGTTTSNLKMCVYSDDGDSTANVGDLKIGCSGDLGSGSTEWVSSAMDGGTLASGNYWVCGFIKSDAASTFTIDRGSTTRVVSYKTSSGFYASPPANLNGLTTTSGAGFSTYVTVGP